MKLFRFLGPNNHLYAQASRLGTWYPLGIKLCPECGASRQKRVSPLILEWELGSDVIGDFTWPGFNDELVISQRAKELFEKQFPEIGFGPVEYWQNPRLKRPVRITRRTKPRVWLPYAGPTLWDVIPQKWCHLDSQRSNLIIEKHCSTCGVIHYKGLFRDRDYIVVEPSSWEGEDIFRVHEYPWVIFCTEKAKEFIEQSEFSNIRLVENGEIFL